MHARLLGRHPVLPQTQDGPPPLQEEARPDAAQADYFRTTFSSSLSFSRIALSSASQPPSLSSGRT